MWLIVQTTVIEYLYLFLLKQFCFLQKYHQHSFYISKMKVKFFKNPCSMLISDSLMIDELEDCV